MKRRTLRLIYPQWQGGVISQLVPELKAKDASLGYALGAELLNFLSPPNKNQKTVRVPVSLDASNRIIEHGISDYQDIAKQTQITLDILKQEQPDRIITFGGECSVSVAPFTFLANKYGKNTSIVWIDAHPDINKSGDKYVGFHAMALGACIGKCDQTIASLLPAKVNASNVVLAGLRAWEEDGGTKVRQAEYGIFHVSPQELRITSDAVIEYLKAAKADKVLIHFDLDVLDPSEIIAAVGVIKDGMKIDEVIRLINDINQSFDVVGLTVAESMPRTAVKLQKMLEALPLFKD